MDLLDDLFLHLTDAKLVLTIFLDFAQAQSSTRAIVIQESQVRSPVLTPGYGNVRNSTSP
ncbi:hypothetical protein FQN55_000533 [Onygenales sp. PD_40]|nr:hypothetical protein FQN55_000533 [Onygenales sp. PD_40]